MLGLLLGVAHWIPNKLQISKRLLLALVGTVTVAVPLTFGFIHQQPAVAQVKAANPDWPAFDVASIHPCEVTGGLENRIGNASPGRLDLGCDFLADDNNLGLIQKAYVWYAGGRPQRSTGILSIIGGPKWVRSQGYKIEATAEGQPNAAAMRGPMLHRLLEGRFKLKIHRETSEVPVYALTVAKDTSKLKPFQEGSCAGDPGIYPSPALPAGQRYCMDNISVVKPSLDAEGVTLDEFSKMLNLIVDRPVIDKTGVHGLFNFHLTFSRDEVTTKLPPVLPNPGALGAASDPIGQTIFTAVQEQLGLKLVPTKGPVEVLVIDSVERPTEN